MCHDMCKCFGRVGENREGMEVMRLFVSLKAVVYFDLFQSTLPANGSDSRKSTRKPASCYFDPRSGAARHIALHELLGNQYACQEDHFELQQNAENISQPIRFI